MKNWTHEKMQLLMQIKFGRLKINLPRDSVLTNDNFVEHSIATKVYGEGKNYIRPDTHMIYTTAKNGLIFWKCWRSKFETCSNCTQVDGFVESDVIANNFTRNNFWNLCSKQWSLCLTLYNKYLSQREIYFGSPLPVDFTFGTIVWARLCWI